MPNPLVIGHINPDTDTTCAAIAAAWYYTETGTPATAVMGGEPNKETAFVLQYFGLPRPEQRTQLTSDDEVIIVDTNNPEELLPGIHEAKIIGIIDHHKLAGGLSTPEPISIRIEPYACTCTILFELMFEAELQIPKEIAGVMAASIISDTLKFTSPTTTEADTKAANALALFAQIDIDTLAEGMFAAKSDLSGLTPTDLLTLDSKIFTLGNRKLRLSVIETTKPENALAMQNDILAAAREMKTKEGLDGVFFYVVDILNSNSDLLLADSFEQDTAAKAYQVMVEGTSVHLPGVVSRKKQMVPNLEKALAE